MTFDLSRRVYLLGNFFIDRVPLIGFPIGNWIKDRRVVDRYFQD